MLMFHSQCFLVTTLGDNSSNSVTQPACHFLAYGNHLKGSWGEGLQGARLACNGDQATLMLSWHRRPLMGDHPCGIGQAAIPWLSPFQLASLVDRGTSTGWPMIPGVW